MEENKTEIKDSKNEIIEKEYYTKSEVDALINKRLLDLTTDIIKRVDFKKEDQETKKVDVQPKNYNF